MKDEERLRLMRMERAFRLQRTHEDEAEKLVSRAGGVSRFLMLCTLTGAIVGFVVGVVNMFSGDSFRDLAEVTAGCAAVGFIFGLWKLNR